MQFYYLTFFLLIPQILSNFTVFSPLELNLQLGKIPYGIANFGDIPYGKKMTGQLVIANPIDACMPIIPYKSGDQKEPKKQQISFVLIARGNCTFVQKSYQAQLLGAKMAVVYDNIDEISQQIIMVEDGHGDEIKIPTIIIPKTQGEQLKAFIEDNPSTEVSMVISFEMWKTNFVDYSFWLNIRNRESYQLIRNFKQYAFELANENAANFSPRYFLDGNFFIGRHNNENCYSNGKYCFMDPDGWGPGKGTDMIDEIVRQICVFQVNPKQWWNYMDKVDEQCIKPSNMKECGQKIMDSLKLDSKEINSCTSKSLSNKDKIDVLDLEIEASRGRSIWPGVSVNNMTYRGNLQERDILEVICASLEKQPPICSQAIIDDNSNSSGLSKTAVIVLVVVILFIFFLFLILAYKRWYQKELHLQMDQKVNPMVNQYIAFYETKSQQAKNDF